MDTLSSIFLVLIVLMSGGIAVLADDLGRRLGKKRLHFKGIRPKRVAQIGTFVAGVVVSLVTILIVAFASSDVRHWLKEGAQAIAERNKALQDLVIARKAADEAQQGVREAQAHFTALKSTNHSLGEQVAQTKGQLSQTKSQLAEQKRQLASLRQKIASLQPRIAVLTQRVAEGAAKRRHLDNLLAAKQMKMAEVAEKLSSTKTTLEKAQAQKSDVDSQNLELLNQNRQLTNLRDELSKNAEELKAQKEELQAQRDKAQKDTDDAKVDLARAQAILADAQQRLRQTQSDLQQAENGFNFLRDINAVARIAPITFQRNEEVARVAVMPGLSVTSAQAALSALLRAARVNALKEGAMPTSSSPEAGIFEHYDEQGKSIPAEDIKESIVAKVAGATQPMVMVASSTFNAFKGEPVSLEVHTYENPLVYKRGDIVAETRIDGRKDATTILHLLTDLGVQVREKAKRDKMIPRLGSDELYGAVSSEDVLTLVGNVKATERPVKVRAVAENDIRAGDPLKLAFVIR